MPAEPNETVRVALTVFGVSTANVSKLIFVEEIANENLNTPRKSIDKITQLFAQSERLAHENIAEHLNKLRDAFGSQLKIGLLSNYVKNWIDQINPGDFGPKQ